MSASVRNTVLSLIAEQAFLDPSEIRLDALPEELGLDSLSMVEAIFTIEEAFDISIPFDTQTAEGASNQKNIGALLAQIEALVGEKAEI